MSATDPGEPGKRQGAARKAAPVALALAAAFAGAGMAAWLGLPAPALLGSTAVLAAMTLAGARPFVPNLLRDISFAVIGVTLGAAITPDFLSDLVRFPATIAALTATVALVMAVTGWILMRIARTDLPTAALATSPGALSVTLALASTIPGALPTVMTLQTLRLVIITLVLPPVIAMTGNPQPLPEASHAVLGYGPTALLVAAAFGLGMALQRVSLPAVFLLSGLAISGLVHFLDIATGAPPAPVTFAGLALAGAVIGARFTGVPRQALLRLALTGILVTVVAMLVSALAALATAWATGFPFPQVWIAFAPGGVEGMAAMAIALGHDPAFVATHHIYRIVLLIVALPVLLRAFGVKAAI